MSKMNFTPSQQDAIDARSGSILVSAAAGSGKTRVLVQRVISLLTDSENPIDADRLLIVTFTNAAAGEMKSRISAAIDDLLVQQPNNESLRRQQLLLPRADICTMDSFCSRIVRENFYLLDINQDYRIGNNGELSAMKRNIIQDIIEEMYAEKREDFLLLSDILSSAKSDSGLENIIISIHEKCNANPFPESWIRQAVEFYNPKIPLSQTIFVKKIYEDIDSVIEFIRRFLDEADEVISQNKSFQKDNPSSAMNCYNQYEGFINSLIKARTKNSWSSISECVYNYKKPAYRKPTGKTVDVTEQECQKVKRCFDSINEAICEKLIPVFQFNDEIYNNDTEQLYPVVKCLSEIILELEKRYFEAKKEKGILDFSDLEHLLLKLLVKQTDNGYEKTDFARNLSKQYDEIMIDEYQDTNEMQEIIFKAISNDENNMFVVGDVKQSIYGFRGAMPENFIRRRGKCTLYDRQNPQFPAKIILDRNFRSRDGIIESINFVFERLMSEKVGGVEYNSEEKLVTGAEYSEITEPEVELHIIENKNPLSENDNEGEDLSDDEAEAKHIVNIINKMINDGFCVKDGNETRKAKYGDFCILLRNPSSHARVYSDILNKNGIPAYTSREYSLFECYEVNVALSFLKIVDNPLQDIPLLSVMMSPIFGFSPDDLSMLRFESKYKNLYASVTAFALNYSQSAENNESDEKKLLLAKKCFEFIELLSYYRRISVTVTTDTLLNMFFEKTGYISVISTMKNGKIRVQNLRRLMNFIREYENGKNNGLTGFVRLISHLEESDNGIAAKDTVPVDSVKIMSIHHSKGLEFPVCIMAATTSRGNDIKDTVLYHSQYGLGMNSIDSEKMLKFSTLQRTFINNQIENEEKSEELRVLYVAMTRAKEKLIVLSTVKAKGKEAYSNMLAKIAGYLMTENDRFSDYSVRSAKNLSDWIIMCALVHPSMNELRADAGAEDILTIPTKSRWKYVHITDISESGTEIEEEDYNLNPSEEMMEFLKKRFAERYAFESRTVIPSKVTASMLAHNKTKFDFVAKSRPAFMQEKKMTGAERGTALHMFMQYADFNKMGNSIDSEKLRIFEHGFISKEQFDSLKDDDINKFIGSTLYKRILSAEKIYKEYRFTVNISAKYIDENTDCDDNVILQGAVDCLFIEDGEIVIVDYKTDRVKEAAKLSELYEKQLKLYKKAIENVFELPVKECIIYSLHLGEQITVET